MDWAVDSLARSADHKWAVFAADQFYLYSSDSSSLTSVPVNTVNPPQDEYGIRGYALNADGTKIAVASAFQLTFFDRSFNVLGSTTLSAAFQTSRSAIQFSSNGSRLFLEYAFPLALVEIDANSYTALGYLSATVDPDGDNLERLLTTDAEGRAYFGIDEGLRIVLQSQTPVPITSASFPGPTCLNLNAESPLNQTQQMTLPNQPTNVDVYIAGQPATLATGQGGLTEIVIPASSIAGPADVECVDSSGDTAVIPAGVS